MSIAIVKISKRAKQLQKRYPNRGWKTCIKEASAEYNSGSLGKPTKKARQAKKVHKAKHHTPKRVGAATSKPVETMAYHKRMMKENLQEKLGRLAIRHYNAGTKLEKRRINKEIAQVKKELRMYC